MTKKSTLERVTNSLFASSTANAVGVFGATITPLAAFVPFLVQTLGSNRQATRLEKMFEDVKAIAEENSLKIQNMTDDQYKVVNEAISAAFYTVNEEKLNQLRNAIRNSIEDPELVEGISDPISRLIRDISADEVRFLLKYRNKSVTIRQISIGDAGTIEILPGSVEETLLSGMINLGLAYSKTSYADIIIYEWSPLVEKLIELLVNE